MKRKGSKNLTHQALVISGTDNPSASVSKNERILSTASELTRPPAIAGEYTVRSNLPFEG